MINEQLAKFSCADERLQVRDALIEWATQRWAFHESRGPLGALPTQKSYALHTWRGEELDHYAGLYPLTTAADFLDFSLFESYTSSIQQSIIRDAVPDLDWFVPEDSATGVEGFFEYLTSRKDVFIGREIGDRIESWRLPSEFQWLNELEYIEGFVSEFDEEAHVCAAAREGFLTVLIIGG